VVSVLARASVVLLDAPSDLARSLSDMPSGGPAATMSMSLIALATLRTVYRSASEARTSVPKIAPPCQKR
jgi:hypothetical protein